MAYVTDEEGGSLLGQLQGANDCLDIAVNERLHIEFASRLARRRMESSRQIPLGPPDTEMAQACGERRLAVATRPLRIRLATEINRDQIMGAFLTWADGQPKA